MNQAFKNLNEIPMLTWSWLHVNDADLKQDFPGVLPYQNTPCTGGATSWSGSVIL